MSGSGIFWIMSNIVLIVTAIIAAPCVGAGVGAMRDARTRSVTAKGDQVASADDVRYATFQLVEGCWFILMGIFTVVSGFAGAGLLRAL